MIEEGEPNRIDIKGFEQRGHNDQLRRYALYAEYGGGFCRMILLNPLEERNVLPFQGCLIGKWYLLVNKTDEESYSPIDEDIIETVIINDVKKVGGLKICCKIKVPIILLSEFPTNDTVQGNQFYSPIIGQMELMEKDVSSTLVPNRLYNAYASLMSFNRPSVDGGLSTQWILTDYNNVSELWDFEKECYVNTLWKKERGVVLSIDLPMVVVADKDGRLCFAKLERPEITLIKTGDMVEFRAIDAKCSSKPLKLAFGCKFITSNEKKVLFPLGHESKLFDIRLKFDEEMVRTKNFKVPGIGRLDDPKNILGRVARLVGKHYYIRVELSLDLSRRSIKWIIVSTVEKLLGIAMLTENNASNTTPSVVQKELQRPINLSHFAPMSRSSSQASTTRTSSPQTTKDSAVSSTTSKNSSQERKPSFLTLSKINPARYRSLAIFLTNKTQKSFWLLYSKEKGRFVRICRTELNKDYRPSEWFEIEYSDYVNTTEYIFIWSQERLIEDPLPTRLLNGIAQFQVTAKKENNQKMEVVGDGKKPLECYSCRLGTFWISDYEGAGQTHISIWCHPDLQKIDKLVVSEVNREADVKSSNTNGGIQRQSTSKSVDEATTNSDEDFGEGLVCSDLRNCPSQQSAFTNNSSMYSTEQNSSIFESASFISADLQDRSQTTSQFDNDQSCRNKCLSVHWYNNPIQVSMLLFNHVTGRFTRTCFVSNESLPFKPTLGAWYLIEYDKPEQLIIRCPSKHHIFIHRMEKIKGPDPLKTRVIEGCAQFLVSAQRKTDLYTERDTFSSCLGALEIPRELDSQKGSSLINVWCRPAREFFTRSMKFSVEEVTTTSVANQFYYAQSNLCFERSSISRAKKPASECINNVEIFCQNSGINLIRTDGAIPGANEYSRESCIEKADKPTDLKVVKKKEISRVVTTIATFDEVQDPPKGTMTSFFKRLFKPFLPKQNVSIEIASDICADVYVPTCISSPIEHPNARQDQSERDTSSIVSSQPNTRDADTESQNMMSEDKISVGDRLRSGTPKKRTADTVAQRLIQQSSSNFSSIIIDRDQDQKTSNEQVENRLKNEPPTVNPKFGPIQQRNDYKKSKAVYMTEKGDEIRWLLYSDEKRNFTQIKQTKKKFPISVSRGSWYEIEYEICENSPGKLHIRIHLIKQTSASVQTRISGGCIQFLMSKAEIAVHNHQSKQIERSTNTNKCWCKLKDEKGIYVEFTIVT